MDEDFEKTEVLVDDSDKILIEPRVDRTEMSKNELEFVRSNDST